MKDKTGIIELSPDEWREFRDLRLRALKEEPLAFGVSFDEEKRKSESFWRDRLENSGKKNRKEQFVFVGASGKLAAMGIIKYALHQKFLHIVRFSGIYVLPQYRGKGIASKLLENMMGQVFKNKAIRKIKLAVNVTQKSAISLYKKFGFRRSGVAKKEFQIAGKFYDALLMEKIR
jgi:ribosomal protein S18 acetylase RimI-like enzyme